MNVKFYNLAKKVNSTKQPAVSDPFDSVDVVLKTPSSILAPVVELNMPTVPAWNYAYIPDMGRYYYVTGTAYNRGVWEISLSVDVMASFKSDIGGTSMYMLRSSAQKTGTLIDDFYPATGDHSKSQTEVKGITSYTSGTIILNLANGDNNTGVASYAFTVSQFGEFLDQIMVDGDKQTATYDPITQNVLVNMYEPIRYINSAYWFPDAYTQYVYPSSIPKTQLKLGNFTATGFQCYPVYYSLSYLTRTYTVNIPKHPQASSRGMFCNMEPYSEYTLNLGPFGGIKLDSAVLAEATSITVNIYQDINTGMGRCVIYTNDDALVANVTTQWGVPLRLFQSSNAGGIGSVLGGIAQGAGAIITGDYSNGFGIGAMVKGVGDMIKGSITSIGSNGAVLDHLMKWYLDATFYTIADADNSNNGRPYCKVNSPSSWTGYMVAQKGLVTSVNATRTELDSINAYMTGGFYYE